tara:strand:- start:3544 stop:4077 length:534 start_codon:yes stop_codon:yes gene_type:complete
MTQTIKHRRRHCEIDGLESLELDIFRDSRGEIWTIYTKTNHDYKFVQDKLSVSKYGVLRGFHGDSDTVKLISCLSGKMQLAVADLRRESGTYGNVKTFCLSEESPYVIIVPAGCVNAHLVLSEKCLFYYKWSCPYQGPSNQVTISWNDPKLNIDWDITDPTLSERDRNGTSCENVYL